MILNLHFIIIVIILQKWKVKYIWSVFLETCIDVAETAYTLFFKLFLFNSFLLSFKKPVSISILKAKYNTAGVI